MKLFIKIKHWHFFLFPCLLPYFLTDSRLSFLIVATILLAFFSTWICSIGIFGQKKLLASGLKNNNTIYLKIACFLMPILWLIVSTYPFELLDAFLPNIISRILQILPVLGFFICWIYSIYFVSKTIKTIEMKTVPKFKNYILIISGMIVIWPVGIWFIQPKVNKIHL